MQQTCSKCGSVATVPSKFCRNCGAPFTNESQATEAATRQYGRQTPGAEVPPTSSPFTGPGQPPPPSVADAFAADTARLHGQQGVPPSGQPYGQSHGQPYGQPPLPAAYQPGMMTGNPVPYPMQPPPKSSWWKWLLGITLATLLVCGGLIGYAVKRASDAVPGAQRKIEDILTEAQTKADQAIDPNAPPSTLKIEQLRYPKSEQIKQANVVGNQILTLQTTDDLTAVRAFYEKLLGAPLVESREQGNQELVFQKPPYLVTVEHDNYDASKLKINIVRSGWIPNLGTNPPGKTSVPPPPPPPAPPAPPGPDGALNFEQLAYPDAGKGTLIKLNERSEFKIYETSDNLDEIKAFYENLLGAPLSGKQIPPGFYMIFLKPPYRVNVSHSRTSPGMFQVLVINYKNGPIPPVLPETTSRTFTSN